MPATKRIAPGNSPIEISTIDERVKCFMYVGWPRYGGDSQGAVVTLVKNDLVRFCS